MKTPFSYWSAAALLAFLIAGLPQTGMSQQNSGYNYNNNDRINSSYNNGYNNAYGGQTQGNRGNYTDYLQPVANPTYNNDNWKQVMSDTLTPNANPVNRPPLPQGHPPIDPRDPRYNSGNYPPPPSWQIMSRDQALALQRRWGETTFRFDRPLPPPPVQTPDCYWARWGDGVRYEFNNLAANHGWFGRQWRQDHQYPSYWWNYAYWTDSFPSSYWWRQPEWDELNRFFSQWNLRPPFYFDYGPGGNFTIRQRTVYVMNRAMASQEDLTRSAAGLASVQLNGTPTRNQIESIEWLPLGTYVLSTSPNNPVGNSKAVIQLAVTRDGNVSGCFFNLQANQAYPLQGQIDRNTQRVAFMITGAPNAVFETGLYNLTCPNVPTLVHQGLYDTRSCVLVRLDSPRGFRNSHFANNNGNRYNPGYNDNNRSYYNDPYRSNNSSNSSAPAISGYSGGYNYNYNQNYRPDNNYRPSDRAMNGIF